MPGAEINPIRAVPRFRFDNARERFLTVNEVERLLYHADRSINPRLGAIVRLLLLTGARKLEMLSAAWRHVDLERRAWFIPDSKTGKARYVPLFGEAVRVIDGLPIIKDCAFMLANPNTQKPYTGLKNPWYTLVIKSNLHGRRIHDLRHSAASFQINAKVELIIVGKIFGHADFKSTMRYSHLANDTLMAAVEAGAAKMGVAM